MGPVPGPQSGQGYRKGLTREIEVAGMVWPGENTGNRTHCCHVEGGGTGSNKRNSERRKFWFKNTFSS